MKLQNIPAYHRLRHDSSGVPEEHADAFYPPAASGAALPKTHARRGGEYRTDFTLPSSNELAILTVWFRKSKRGYKHPQQRLFICVVNNRFLEIPVIKSLDKFKAKSLLFHLQTMALTFAAATERKCAAIHTWPLSNHEHQNQPGINRFDVHWKIFRHYKGASVQILSF